MIETLMLYSETLENNNEHSNFMINRTVLLINNINEIKKLETDFKESIKDAIKALREELSTNRYIRDE
ncbi:MAG: hypothetical protein EVJ46_09645 [Candidatus Acididesulfobacter guangdongensis]|uniref:Uncharacterized protein n=1 Tax=Acididesulfobacter guangdongensis TaxID=2597225 RepID=A0A519BET1_ACIG2|nr:MAG: hypothetical protein EVJ46_09645 [Candidatus Acididesulfobacter guangdongensis]